MRIRIKKWAKPELAACPFYVDEPDQMKGHWADAFPNKAPLHIELGCGKGVSTCEMALDNPDVNYLALDINSSVLGVAKRNAEAAYAGKREVDNLRLTNHEVELITDMLAPEDRVERIYISFPNPWTQRSNQRKHRLVHIRQLMRYRHFLVDGGEIWFKTDDDRLFNESLEYFSAAGYEITYLTRDLHADPTHPNYESEHEKLFTAQGIPTKALIAVKREAELDEEGLMRTK